MARALARRTRARSVGVATTTAAVLGATGLLGIAAAGGAYDSITEFSVVRSEALPTAIAAAPDGTVWIAQGDGALVAVRPDPGDPRRVRRTQLQIPSEGSLPRALTSGADGTIWFTEQLGNRIGRVRTDGTVQEYALPTPGSGPTGITTGPDHAIWFTEQLGNRIGRITPDGTVQEYALPTPGSGPTGITTGPDHAIWFTEQYGNRIGRITPDGTVQEYQLPTPASGPIGITTGPDDAIWFTEQFGNRIGRIATDPTHTITEIELPSEAGFPESIAVGPDGALWFTERDNRQLGRIAPGSRPRVTEFALQANASGAVAVTGSCDGRLWFAQLGGEVGAFDQVGRNTCQPPATLGDARASAVSVLGVSRLTAAQLASWFRATRAPAHLSAGLHIDALAQLFIEEASAAGVRADLAFAQSILETGSFSFPAGGQLTLADNNFAGLGACDSCSHGRSFPTARDGVRAQMQHLRNYADPASRATDLGFAPSPWWYGSNPEVAARHFDTFFAKGRAPSWLDMGNGNWATAPHYSEKVLAIYRDMLEFAASDRTPS